MPPINSACASIDSSGFGLSRGFNTSSENVSLTTPNNSSPIHHNVVAPMNNSKASDDNKMDKSPLHISTMLSNLSINNTASSALGPASLTQGSYLLKLKNLPEDITLRECYSIFALAHGVYSIELAKVSEDIYYESNNCIITRFDSLHLACQYASMLDSKNQIFGPSFPFKTHVEIIDELTQQYIAFNTHDHQNQVSHSPHVHSQSASGFKAPSLSATSNIVTTTAVKNGPNIISPPHSASNSVRPSLLAQRSRFAFSDPFNSGATVLNNNPTGDHQPPTSIPLQHHSHSNDSGKSFLLMENHEINDSIWGVAPTISSSISGLTTSQPQTPAIEWNSAGRKQSSSLFAPASSTSEIPSMHLTNPLSNPLATGLQQQQQPSHASHQHQMPILQPQNSLSYNVSNQTASSSSDIPQQSKTVSHSQVISTSTSQKSGPRGSTSKSLTGPKNAAAALQNTNGISQIDLSLLARVPPPANPADQNPPCNTLYVGNLPPDATEQELRQLFSSQKGFRRLSFRNKNNNGNGHGPMCFVEFEDVTLATRALAELYGRQLPRSTGSHSNKGGIRLSFSKNPLGVRGPNSRRSGSVANSGTHSSSIASTSGYNYATGYGKS